MLETLHVPHAAESVATKVYAGKTSSVRVTDFKVKSMAISLP
jgi:hypothetical protein